MPQRTHSMIVEFDELFALRDRLRELADVVRERLFGSGYTEPLEAEVFDQTVELSGEGENPLFLQLDSHHLEISGAPPDLAVHRLAALILNEAGVFRLSSVEAGFQVTLTPQDAASLNMVHLAFDSGMAAGSETMLDRRFSMTWEWGTATTGYSFHVGDTEDKELFLGMKARIGYLTLPDLQNDAWVAEQSDRFDEMVAQFLSRVGWNA